MQKLLDKQELEEEIKKLVGFEKRYYEFLHDICWMSEVNQAKGLKVGRSKLRTTKRDLIERGLLLLDPRPMGKRKNLKHILLKSYPIILEGERESSYRYSPDDLESFDEYCYVNEVNWSLIQQYTADDINQMSKIEKIQLYMDCGFIVLPTNYPIFTPNGVECSCSKGINCSSKGKHPIHTYSFIDSFNYERMKPHYLDEFKKNPALNIGFKVMGFSVLDVDFKHNGDKTLQNLESYDEIDITHYLTVSSGNGFHIYADNKLLKNTASAIGQGLDIRSENGFIMAPGSQHQSGNYYQWREIGEVATIPESWLSSDSEEDKIPDEKVITSRSNLKINEKLKDIKLPVKLTSDYVIKAGERELTLFKWACRERGKGANAEQLYDILITIRDTYCEEGEEPVTDDEVKHLADSVASSYPTNAQKNLGSFNPRNN